jgi:rod shape-determining protein MreD
LNWILVLVIAYLLCLMQTGMTSWLRWWGEASPNLLLVLLIFLGLHAPLHTLAMASVVLGVAYDLTHSTPFGFGTISFALIGLSMVQLRQMVFREHPISHATLGLVCGVMLAVILVVLQWFRGWVFEIPIESRSSLGVLLKSAVLTIPATVVLVWLLRKYRSTLGLKGTDFQM